jgi:hypothetical protein
MDFDPRDFDSRDDERQANTSSGEGRGGSSDRDRDDDWSQPDTIDCIHNRARLYHVHSKALYHVIGGAGSRYRRPVSPRLAIERLRLLDAVLTTPDLEWFTTAAEKAAYLARLTAADGARTEQTTSSEPAAAPPAALPGTFPIGMNRMGERSSCTSPQRRGQTGSARSSEGMPRCSDSRRRGCYESRFRARSMSSTTRIS